MQILLDLTSKIADGFSTLLDSFWILSLRSHTAPEELGCLTLEEGNGTPYMKPKSRLSASCNVARILRFVDLEHELGP